MAIKRANPSELLRVFIGDFLFDILVFKNNLYCAWLNYDIRRRSVYFVKGIWLKI